MKIGDRVLVQSKFPDATWEEEYGTVVNMLDFIVKVQLDYNGVSVWLSFDVYEITPIPI